MINKIQLNHTNLAEINCDEFLNYAKIFVQKNSFCIPLSKQAD